MRSKSIDRLPPPIVRSLLIGGALLQLHCDPVRDRSAFNPGGLARSVDRVLAEHRPYALLLASNSARQPCFAPARREAYGIPTLICGSDTDRAPLIRDAAAIGPRVSAALATDTSNLTLHTAGRFDLMVGANDRVAITRAARRLDQAVFRDSTNAALLRDAATAHALAAGIERDAVELLRAVDLIERAALRDSLDPTIQFNRAVLLEAVGLVGESAAAWERAAIDRLTRIEAETRLEQQRARDRGVGIGEPETLRESALGVLLPEWGRTTLNADHDSARSRVDSAERIGARLAAGGDSTVLAAVALVRKGGIPARALAAYGTARRRFERAEFEAAQRDFELVLADLHRADCGPEGRACAALWAWPAIYLAICRLYAREYRSADSLLALAELATRQTPFLALRGRALWGMALSDSRQGRFRAAGDRYRGAIALFARSGEHTSVGAVQYQLAEVSMVIGDVSQATAAYIRAARAYEHGPRDVGTLHESLMSFAGSELRIGRPYVALVLLREAARVSRRTNRIKDVPEALARLAAAEIELGRLADSRAHLSEARSFLDSIASPLMREAVEAQIDRVEARLASGAAAEAQVTRVVAYFARQRLPYSLAHALVQRSDTRMAILDTLGAERDLDSAITLVRHRAGQLDALASASAREVERGVFERSVSLLLSRGHPERALAEIDGQRGWSSGGSLWLTETAARLAPEAAILAWAALPERLIVWSVTRNRFSTRETPIGRRELARRVDRLEELIRIRADTGTVSDAARDLYQILLGPIELEIRGKQRLALVADPVLAGLPFAALRSPVTGRYLLKDHVLSHAFGIREALAALGRSERIGTSGLLLVGNPSIDRASEPGLPPLRYAAAETDSIGGLYPGAVVLDGGAATKASVRDRLGSASVFHFAGHAVAARRGRGGSRLVLAPDGSVGGEGSLAAEQIAGLRLTNLRLAILSACETLSRGGADSYRLDGLAEAFLAAGAGGVIGSLWAVDDEGTTRLMVRLHRALSSGLPPGEALRAAQLATLDEPGGHGTGLRAWAAFRYVTR